jgi:exopolysaccharide biosynthesis polyprenyl glycosylphosphotransferase
VRLDYEGELGHPDARVGERDEAAGRRERVGARVGASRRFRPVAPVRASSRLPPDVPDAPARRQTRLRDGHYRWALAVSDAAVIATVLLVLDGLRGATRFSWAVLLAMPLMVLVNKLGGLYDRDALVLKKTTLDEAPALAQFSGLFSLVVWLIHDLLIGRPLHGLEVLVLWASSFALLLVGRAVARIVARALSARERCLIIGEPPAVALLTDKLARSRAAVEVVEPLVLRGERSASAYASDQEAFWRLLRERDVHRVVIAPTGAVGADDTLELVRLAKAAGVRVSVVPRLFEVIGTAVQFDHLDGLTVLGLPYFGLSRSSRLLKRAFDFAGASLLLVLTLPLMAVIAVVIRLESPGPVLFRQQRVGRDGGTFSMLKFRSMVPQAEALKDSLRHLNQARGLFKIPDDPRITRVGAILRRTSLDELPQLFNVWRGEMSLVGPRPLVLDEDARVEGLYRSRLHLTPGMTGHWQILGSARIPLDEMLAIDYLYVANWSLWTDIKIILRTIPHMLARGGQ